LVCAHRIRDFEAALQAAFQQVRIGDPFDSATQIGTLAMRRQFERVSDYVRIGKDEGARLVVGGRRPQSVERGYFFEPTLFSNANNTMRIAREEVFGPVLTLIPYESVDDAIRIANDSEYGLHGAIFTRDVDRAYALARRLRTGNVGMCANTMDLTMPFGGWKQSGIGREGGLEGFHSFTEIKTVFLPSIPGDLQSS
jgi:acyl-CoA reductase-like NAD-dependent aldehyde dehydrogenase